MNNEIELYDKLVWENEHIATYLNVDGTKTIYVFTAPMERRALYKEHNDNHFIRRGDYVEVDLPVVLSRNTDIRISGDLHIYPYYNASYSAVFEERSNAFDQKMECMTYCDLFGNGVNLCCYPTPFGVNTEIIIPEYTGNNIFELKIKQPIADLYTVENSPDYIILRDEDTIRSIIYTPLIIDADNKWCFKNRIVLSKDISDDSYIVKYIVDDDFLKDSNTKYPVTLNQSICAYIPKQSDTAMYSGVADKGNHHLSPYMLIGDITDKGEGWGFPRFEVLYKYDIPADKIISAEYFFNNLFTSEKEIKIGAFAILNDWCSINTRWNTRPTYDTVAVKTAAIKSNGIYSIDITKLFRVMMENKYIYEPLYSIRNSFFIKSMTHNSNLLFAAGDSGLFSPYLKIVCKA